MNAAPDVGDGCATPLPARRASAPRSAPPNASNIRAINRSASRTAKLHSVRCFASSRSGPLQLRGESGGGGGMKKRSDWPSMREYYRVKTLKGGAEKRTTRNHRIWSLVRFIYICVGERAVLKPSFSTPTPLPDSPELAQLILLLGGGG